MSKSKMGFIGKTFFYRVSLTPDTKTSFPTNRYYRVGRYIISGLISTRYLTLGYVKYDTLN